MRFPSSFGQQRLWFLDQLAPGEPTYNVPYRIWLDGQLDARALQRAMDTVVARHGALRTSLVALDGVPEQVVDDSAVVEIELIELPPAPDDAGRTRLAETIAHERALQPFDLAAGPLARAALIGITPDRHLFSLVMHHAITDGASGRILLNELSAAYRAETTGALAALPPLVMDYGDYAAWQRDRMRGEELDRQLGYWRAQVLGAPKTLAIPADRPRPARLSSRGAQAAITIDAAVTRRLAAVAADNTATMFMVFFTGFAAVLSRYSHQTDLVIGTTMAGRTHTELDPIVGLFANTLPLRVSLADDPTFAGLLDRVRDVTVDALEHQETPFDILVQEFAPERTLSHAPLVQVQLLYGSLTPPTLDLPGVISRSEVQLTETAKHELILYADPQDGGATKLTLEYSTDLFSPGWAGRFLRCTARLLEQAAAAPDTPVADLPLLPDDELDALILGRNHQSVADDDSANAWRLLHTSTSRVTDRDQSLPMSQVLDRAARIARILAGCGVGPETLVGLCVGRSTDMLAALLGVWWAGAAYVPLDPAFPVARLTTMARDAGVRVVVTDAAHHDLACSVANGATVVGVGEPATAAAAPLDRVPVADTALAYVIFTSGSTGQPKGVGIERRAVGNLLTSFRRVLQLGHDDGFVAVTTLSFDMALLELLLPLVCGADLVIATADEAREPDRLRSLIERTGATVLQATPQTWRLLESAGGVPAGLRLRLCGGEAFPLDLADQLMGPGVSLWNLYGPTETTVWSAAGRVTSAARAAEIGPPIDHTRVYVLDEHMMPVPVGVVGEVCLGGSGVARGYHNRPQLTARSFRPDPWSDEPGARLYRTGDLGRWLEGEGLELLGRNDHQVKIHGFRIECGEIETVLRRHRDVDQAAVVTAPRAGDLALVAYVVPRPESPLADTESDLLRELRPHLRATLPGYMVPALVVALPTLPLTPTAKVDRAALPAPQWDAASPAATDRDQPRNPVEAALARIWADLLGSQAPVGVHDNLFALGGHSLTATRFVARVADAYGVNLPVHQVFAGPTVAELAEIVSADPAFGAAADGSRHAELDALSDEDLDELLRAAIAQRTRRRAAGGGLDS